MVVLSSATVAGGHAEPTRPVPVQAGQYVGGTVQPAATTPSGGNHEDVKMHGHWVIDVRNPDGTLAQHRKFENSITYNAATSVVRSFTAS